MATTIDYRKLKAAGVYTLEIDNTETPIINVSALRLLVGFNPTGVFNRPVLLSNQDDRNAVFGDVDRRLERYGSFFNRSAQIMLDAGPIFALNLLYTDERDFCNYSAFSLDASTPNQDVRKSGNMSTDPKLARLYSPPKSYVDKGGNFIGAVSYPMLFDRSRFWKADPDNLAYASMAASGSGVKSISQSNLFNVANVGTEDISILVFKPTGLTGYDITAREWYGGENSIPYQWIRPTDYMSDYFIQIVAIKGSWTDFSTYATDPYWSDYFTDKGVRFDQLDNFLSANGVSIVGSWIGSIIPHFKDKTGAIENIEDKVNSSTTVTGIMMNLNKDALASIFYDQDSLYFANDPTGEDTPEEVEAKAPFGVDLVGHGLKPTGDSPTKRVNFLSYNYDVPATGYSPLEIANPLFAEIANCSYFGSLTEVVIPEPTSGLDSTTLTKAFIEASAPAGTLRKYMNEFLNIPLAQDKWKNEDVLKLIERLISIEKTRRTLLKQQKTRELIKEKLGVETNRDARYFNELKTGDMLYNINKNVESSGVIEEFRQLIPGNTRITNIRTLTLEHIIEENKKNKNYPIHPALIEFYKFYKLLNKTKEVKYKIATTLDPVELKVGFFEQAESKDTLEEFKSGYESTQIAAEVIFPSSFTLDGEVSGDEALTNMFKLYFPERMKEITEHPDNPLHDNNLSPTDVSDLSDIKGSNTVTIQKPITSELVSKSLRLIPLKGLRLSKRHLPGFDRDGHWNPEAGMEKIYSMLEDSGIQRGLTNPDMINFRYVVDSMAYGLGPNCGGKRYLSRLAKSRGKCTSIINAPSIKQFENNQDPFFCDTFNTGAQIKPPFDTKYIPEGGNKQMVSTNTFNLPSEDDGGKFAAVFSPFLKYNVNGEIVSMPPAADVSNVFMRKYNGGDPYGIVANQNGIMRGRYLTGVEMEFDQTDRGYLEPMGINPIVQKDNNIMIYGNRTCFQRVRSDFNLLHVRELLNTIEIEVEAILSKYVFDFNNASTRGMIVTLINPILSAMKQSGALYDYTIKMDSSNNTDELIQESIGIIDIRVEITKGMEKIIQRLNVDKKGRISSSN